ncbi:MAG: GNAT family N-acetyltransferase [Candidatus Kapabacteria bacterium]|nr:GNAT family N-acetyltransferase [Candidatus Kapabacteria bacterium]
MEIVALAPERFDEFIELIAALAAYEKLSPPAPDAIARLRNDAFGNKPRYEAFLALDSQNHAIGYAICFETYSSFLAKPTMYLEDLFVLEDKRTSGAGGALFDHVEALGRERDCGRVDWQVLDWNMLARDFYAKRNAEWMHEWLLYRITL